MSTPKWVAFPGKVPVCQDCGTDWQPVRRGECIACGSDAGPRGDVESDLAVRDAAAPLTDADIAQLDAIEPFDYTDFGECTCGHDYSGHDADGCFPECGCVDPGPRMGAVKLGHGRLSNDERHFIADMISDAFMPYGQEFSPEDAGDLIEARIETLLRRRTAPIRERAESAEAIVREVVEFARDLIDYEQDHAAGAETPTLLAVASDLREMTAPYVRDFA